MNSTNVLGAFLLGGAIGATLGVLYAPDKGSNTRRNIIGKKDELLDEAESKIEEGKDYVKTKYQEGKDKLHDKFQESKEKLSDLTAKAREKADGVKNDLEDSKSKTRQPGYSPSM